MDFLYRHAQQSDTSSPSENAADGGMADVFAQTAMSLGLDNDDLLFNMMFFEDGSLPNFGAIMNTMQQETLALHSENNTPYKLNPANAEAISHLLQEKFCSGEDNECAVCKDEIDVGADIIRIPKCRHYFHAECLSRWIQLQSWCPVCRSSLESTEHVADAKSLSAVAQTLRFDEEEKDEHHHRCSCSDLLDEKAVLHKARRDVAFDSAEKIISGGIGRAIHRELASAKD